MKTLRKILLSTVLTVFVSVPANAGEMTLSGSMEISATTGLSGSNSGGRLGQENELTVKGSTELDDGTTVSYEQTLQEITQETTPNYHLERLTELSK